MAEQTFRSPGFYEQEIELVAGAQQPVGVPGGIIGTAQKGPAFVPVTLANMTDFTARFGDLDPQRFAPYAVNEFLKHKLALTFLRVLGAGANSTLAHIATTNVQGTVRNAGFKIVPAAPNEPADAAIGTVTTQAITANAADLDKGFSYTDTAGIIGRVLVDHTIGGISAVDSPVAGTYRIYVGTSDNPSANDFAARIDSAIAALNVAGVDVTSTVLNNIVTLTQATAGAAGNTTIAVFGGALSATLTLAGFSGGDDASEPWTDSTVQFIAAKHYISASNAGPTESDGFPVFTDNPSFSISTYGASSVNLIRGVIFPASGTRIQVAPYNGTYSAGCYSGTLGPENLTDGLARRFKIIISSSDGASFDNDDGFDGVKILTASLDPTDNAYISRILNTDPDLFAVKKHLLYLDFPVEKELAPVMTGTAATEPTVLILSGTSPWQSKFGRYDTRFTTPRTPAFISQPFGAYEYDLFHFETISDGEYANDKLKVSISNIQASTDPDQPYGTFDVTLRQFGDDDLNPQGLEYYPAVSLNPKAENYIAKAIGDKKVQWNFDTDERSERRLLISGKYPNRSVNFRVIMNSLLEAGQVPASALPFGFRGIPVLKTNESLCDGATSLNFESSTFSGSPRLTGPVVSPITASIIPPLPYRYKVTRGTMTDTAGSANIGTPGANERVDSRLYWGVVVQSMPTTASVDSAVLNYNLGTLQNSLVNSYTKFQGITKQGVLATGIEADAFNANKFTLARVALANQSLSTVTGTAELHMREAAYVRDGVPSPVDYKVNYGSADRVTLATLVASSSVKFNRFASFNKYTSIFYGGFDGLNILDRDNRLMNDKSCSSETGYSGDDGKAIGEVEAGLVTNAAGTGVNNNIVYSYRSAIDIITDEISSNVNIIAIPGIRDPLITTYAQDSARDYSLAMYVRDIPSYDDNGFRIFDDTEGRRPSVRQTSETFTSLNIDNNYAATYFPDVYINDSNLNKKVKVPASIAALGAIAYNDKVAYPWFAPAGFNRAALDFVTNVQVRLNQADRDTLYDSRINPIATFPAGGFVIFGQKTLQLKKSALDRVNVRRLLLEVKRVVSDVAGRLLFEQNTPAVRSRFIASVNPLLGLIQAQAGIEKFRVIMDDSNNTPRDAEQNRLNGKIVLVPTKTIEFIAVDFVITPSGVSFE